MIDELNTASRLNLDAPSMLHTIVRIIFQEARETSLVRWTCFNAAQRDTSFASVSGRWQALLNSFWERAAGALGMSAAACRFAGAVLEAVGRGYLLAANTLLYDVVMTEVCQRLVDRLHGQFPLAKSSDWRAALRQSAVDNLAPATDFNPTQERIVAAAAAIIFENGPNAASHRAIAKRAGVSLSSTTHHFKSRTDILLEGFRRIVVDSAGTLAKGMLTERTLETSEFVEGTTRIFTGEGVLRATAAQEIEHLAASDPDLRSLGIVLLSRAGETSTKLVASLKTPPPNCDDLDGLIWRGFQISLINSSISQAQNVGAFDPKPLIDEAIGFMTGKAETQSGPKTPIK